MGKPFLLPQRNPWLYYDRQLNSYNTPDFTLQPVSLNARKAAGDIISSKRVTTEIK